MCSNSNVWGGMTPTPPPARHELGQPCFHSRSLFNSNYAYLPPPHNWPERSKSLFQGSRENSVSLSRLWPWIQIKLTRQSLCLKQRASHLRATAWPLPLRLLCSTVSICPPLDLVTSLRDFSPSEGRIL